MCLAINPFIYLYEIFDSDMELVVAALLDIHYHHFNFESTAEIRLSHVS